MEIVVPRPVPPYFRVIDSSAWANRSKIRFCASAGMPMPVSTTSNRTVTLAGVSDSEQDPHPDLPALRELHRVPEQVQKDLAEEERVPLQEEGQPSGPR